MEAHIFWASHQFWGKEKMNLVTEHINKNNIDNNKGYFNYIPLKKKVSFNSNEYRMQYISNKRKNGLFERIYDALKNVSGIGVSKKKVEKALDEYEKGNIDEKTIENNINGYRNSQKNAEQMYGDVLSVGASVGAYYGLNNLLSKYHATVKIKGSHPNNVLGSLISSLDYGSTKKIYKKVDNFVKNLTKNKRMAVGAVGAMLVGGIVKFVALKFNRIGSKEYKYDKKVVTKQERKNIKKARRKENRRNFLTGTLNGVLTPVIGLAGGVVGVPLYLAVNIGARYFKTSGENKSFSDFKEKLKNNAGMNILGATLLAIPMIRKNNFSKVLNKNLSKIINDLDKSKLQDIISGMSTAYADLEKLLVDSTAIKKIMKSSNDINDQIKKLTDENIFAVKFMQISDEYGVLSKALRESCPSTRTVDEASAFIKNVFSGKYEVTKQLGVGTIAETYLAKDVETGKEVCIKILKKGISAEKIQKDKEKFAALIKSEITDERKREYYLRNLEDLAEGICKEVDFANEMNAANELAKYTSKANVVRPIEVKDNIYVMEKANGISLRTLCDIVDKKTRMADYIKNYGDDFYKVTELKKAIEDIKAKNPAFDFDDITLDQMKLMLKQYMEVNVEQFNAIPKNGKTIHADIHPGNVFIDLAALKTCKGKLLTLIDTGNVINMSKAESLDASSLTQYIKDGNVKNIASYIIEGASLPEGMTKADAIDIVQKGLSKIFFDNETELEPLTNDLVLKITDDIMQKNNIVPAATQLNFEKAKTSAEKSFDAFVKSFMEAKYGTIDELDSKTRLQLISDFTSVTTKYVTEKKKQEMKNILNIGLKNYIKNSKNKLAKNSEEYLTYEIKQLL